ncbi:hypothetical protein C0993_002738 [Termitomyces sp. T159_Od127]|nr:hypothetical protein C0993_002738 [Termitomyces sp. T159_Od127]
MSATHLTLADKLLKLVQDSNDVDLRELAIYIHPPAVVVIEQKIQMDSWSVVDMMDLSIPMVVMVLAMNQLAVIDETNLVIYRNLLDMVYLMYLAMVAILWELEPHLHVSLAVDSNAAVVIHLMVHE